MAPVLRLKSIRVTGADTTPLAEDKKTYVYSVAVTNGKKTYDTPWANECHWEVDFPIEPSDTIHAVSFKLYRTRKNLPIWRHRNLGSASFETQMIEDTEEAGEAKEMKTDMKAEKSTKDSLTLVVKAVGPETSPNANSDPSGTLGAPPNVAHKWNPPDIPENLLENAETLGGMLQLIQPFKEVFDSIAEFHPVAKGAWLVVSGAYQVLKNQHDRDGQLVDLYNLMMKTYEIATENDLYKRVGDKKLCVVIDAMVKQSKECSIFISNYGSRRYLYRILTGSEASTRIQDYKASFSDLQKAFTSSQIDLTARRVLEIESIVLSQESKSKLVELAPSTRSPGAITRCKYGTRQQSLLKITNWITQGDESVFWLNGVAGCGKSSLMGTMIQVIQQMGARSRLAAFIRFDRSAYNEARVVVRELAYQLAFFDSRLGEAIADAFQTTNRILSPDLESQLKQLVLDPLYQCREALEKDGPVTIIFDGLDECKDDDFFRELLTFFSDNVFSSFPHIRVIIASRPEAHICDAFSNADSQDLFPHILQFRLDTSSKETREDIQFYIEKELSSIKEKGFQDLCVQKNAAAELAKRAGGLFIWAVVILNFLRGYACPRLETVLETDPPVDALSALTTLYQTALNSIAGLGGDIRRDLRILLGFIKFTFYRPFFDKGTDWTLHLQSMLESYTGTPWSSKLPVLHDKLSSLLVYDEFQGFQLIHKSLDDFLTDHQRCGDDWFLDHHEIYKNLTSACSKLLMFYLGNACMSNSVSSEKRAIQYASFLWGNYHRIALQTGSQDNNVDIEAEVSHFLQQYLLQWVFYAVAGSYDDRYYTVLFLSEGLIHLSENLDKTRDDPFAQLIHEAHRLSSALCANNYHQVQKANTILYFFHFLCAAYRKDVKILHWWYMPVFVQMAGGSRNYGDIIEAIKELNDYPLLLSEEATLAENIEIFGVPEVIDDKMLAKVDWDLKKSLDDYLWVH